MLNDPGKSHRASRGARRTIKLNLCSLTDFSVMKAAFMPELFLTVVHAEDNGGTEKGTDGLEEEVHGELPPALSAKQAQSKGHGRVQMAACE